MLVQRLGRRVVRLSLPDRRTRSREGDGADGYPNVTDFWPGQFRRGVRGSIPQIYENTLIVTRDVSLPQNLLTKVKRDIQLWALSSRDCSA